MNNMDTDVFRYIAPRVRKNNDPSNTNYYSTKTKIYDETNALNARKIMKPMYKY